jgi:hypothetical protein
MNHDNTSIPNQKLEQRFTKDERLNEVLKWSLEIHPFMFVLRTRNKNRHGLQLSYWSFILT